LACAQRGDAILDQMSTADVARDLDAMRQAVGDAALNYYGVSYGTRLLTYEGWGHTALVQQPQCILDDVSA
jgi:hypothetical protein